MNAINRSWAGQPARTHQTPGPISFNPSACPGWNHSIRRRPLVPLRIRRRSRTAFRAIMLLIVLPTLLAGFYFGFYRGRSLRVGSQVRGPQAQAIRPAARPQSLWIDDAPKGLGGDNSYVVRDFLNSRDALGLLLDKTDFCAEVSRAGNDWFWRFPGPSDRQYR